MINSLKQVVSSDALQVFWLPPDSEDKISLSITVLLAFTVFQFVVTDLTPASSDRTPIIGTIGISLHGVSISTNMDDDDNNNYDDDDNNNHNSSF